MTFEEAAAHLVETSRDFQRRGWVLGTSGNFSIVLDRNPLRLAITASSLDKGKLTATQIMRVDGNGKPIDAGDLRPSAETLLHTAIAQQTDAVAIFHTHSVWSTVLSDYHHGSGGFFIEGYEMLKGLSGVRTHEHREWLPIIENSQDMAALAVETRTVVRSSNVRKMLIRPRHEDPLSDRIIGDGFGEFHGFLIRRHGLYTWGASVAEAVRHVEILEFLLESVGRRQMIEPQP